MSIVQVKFGKTAPSDLPKVLRSLADQVEDGQVTDFIACYVEQGDYHFSWATSLFDAVGMSAMLHAQALLRMKGD